MQGTALITGASKRIGHEISLALARAGMDIALHYNSSAQPAQQAAKQIRALGVQCQLFQADLSDLNQAVALVEHVFTEMPDCNVLVNNASVFQRASLQETAPEFFDRQFNVNFKAPFFMIRRFAALCGKGCVVNLLDTRVTRPGTTHFAYTLSKKALYEMTKMAAKELAPRIRVNGVCPGLILPSHGQPADSLKQLAAKIPLRRQGTPQEVAQAVLSLLQNEYLTGQCIFVDGGESIK